MARPKKPLSELSPSRLSHLSKEEKARRNMLVKTENIINDIKKDSNNDDDILNKINDLENIIIQCKIDIEKNGVKDEFMRKNVCVDVMMNAIKLKVQLQREHKEMSKPEQQEVWGFPSEESIMRDLAKLKEMGI